MDNGSAGCDSYDMQPPKPATLPIDKQYHVFISYSGVSPDRETALKIDKLLTEMGYRCCLHERDFLPGDAIVNNIVKHIERSIKVVFLLSENSASSNWCQFEFNVTETIHIQNKGFKPIILKLDDCEVPDMMRKYTYLHIKKASDWVNRLTKAINDTTDHLISSRKNIKFVAVPCIDYNRDKDHVISRCRYPHVCAKYIVCDEPCNKECGKNHDLVTDQSREILVDLGFVTEGNYEALLEKYRHECKQKLASLPNTIVTGPCCYYNYKGCLLGDFHCPFTHICKNWFLDKCNIRNCRLSHDILEPHTKRLLEIFQVDISKSKDEILDEYRLKYPHKTFLSSKTTKTKFVKENCMFFTFILCAIIAITFEVALQYSK